MSQFCFHYFKSVLIGILGNVGSQRHPEEALRSEGTADEKQPQNMGNMNARGKNIVLNDCLGLRHRNNGFSLQLSLAPGNRACFLLNEKCPYFQQQ